MAKIPDWTPLSIDRCWDCRHCTVSRICRKLNRAITVDPHSKIDPGCPLEDYVPADEN